MEVLLQGRTHRNACVCVTETKSNGHVGDWWASVCHRQLTGGLCWHLLCCNIIQSCARNCLDECYTILVIHAKCQTVSSISQAHPMGWSSSSSWLCTDTNSSMVCLFLELLFWPLLLKNIYSSPFLWNLILYFTWSSLAEDNPFPFSSLLAEL